MLQVLLNTKKYIFLLMLCISSCSFADTAQVKIHHWENKQKVPIYFVQTPHKHMLDIRLVFTAGSAFDANSFGLSQLTTEMLNQGTDKNSFEKITHALDSIGARYSTHVTKDMSTITLRTLTDSSILSSAITNLHDIITQPAFPQKQLNLSKKRMLSYHKYKLENPQNVARNLFFQTIYAGTPYAHAIYGTSQSIQSLTRQQIIDFYKQYFVAHNAKIILIGDISSQQAHHISDTLMQGLPSGHAAKLSLSAHASIQDSKTLNFPSTQTALMIGQRGITRENQDYFPLIVGNELLGGSSMSSQLFKTIRNEKGLTYSIYSRFDPLLSMGSFYISFKTQADQANYALSLVNRTLTDFINITPNAAQLADVKHYLIRSFPLHLASNKQLLSVVTNIAFYNRPLDYLSHYPSYVNAVTAKQVHQAFTHLIHPDKLTVIAVGPQDKTDEQ